MSVWYFSKSYFCFHRITDTVKLIFDKGATGWSPFLCKAQKPDKLPYIQPELRGLLTERVHESSSTLLVATIGFSAGVDDRHAVIGQGRCLCRRTFVFRVTAAGAVVTARGRGVGV